MTRRVFEKLCTKKVCVDFLAPTTRAPTTGPTRVDFPVFSSSRTPTTGPTKRPTKASTEVPTKVSSQVVEVHLSCFHLFCSSAIQSWLEIVNPSPSVLRIRWRPCVRVGFWQNGFFADFYFWAAGFFRGYSRRICSPHFCGKKCPEKSSRKIPGKILQNLYNKNPRHISAEGPAQHVDSHRMHSIHIRLVCDHLRSYAMLSYKLFAYWRSIQWMPSASFVVGLWSTERSILLVRCCLRDEIVNPGLKISISIKNFNLGVSIYGALLGYREGLDRKFQSTINRSTFSIPKAAIKIFNPRALWELVCVY